MYRFSDWLNSLRPDFWGEFYAHPELLKLFAHINSVLAASTGGYKLLELYDIVDIGEHNPGETVSWMPLYLTGYSYVETADYPHQYVVDDNWIYIDCLHDKHADPTVTLQNLVDFRLDKGILSFIKFPPIDTLLVSKGLYAGTRLKDDFGTAFGYERKDSYQYRDRLVPLTAMFYEGPSIHNLKAAANVMISNPVAKYGEETIINTQRGDVITDKYRYNLGGARLAYNVGDKIRRHSPFADAIEFSTDKTSPNWWLNRLPQLFQKYKLDGVISEWQRNAMMDTFLKYFVAHVRINLNKVDWRQYEYNPDIWQLILDASPTRTDYILSMYYHQVDKDVPLPNFDVGKMKLTTFSIWGNKDVGNAEQWLYAPREVTPVIYPDGETNVDWFVDSNRYHILDENTGFQEFWSSEPSQLSYVEPHVCHWYCRNTMTPNIPVVSKRSKSNNMPMVESLGTKVRTYAPIDSNVVSIITDDATVSGVGVLYIYGDQNIAHEDFDEWEHHDTHLGIDGLVVGLGSTGYSISPPMQVGRIPKTVRIRPSRALASNTSIEIQYSTDRNTWLPLPDTGVVTNVSGNIYYKAIITASSITSPVLKGLDITIRV